MPFQPFDLGQVLQTAEAIKGARRQSVTDQLQQQYLGQRIEADKFALETNQRAQQVVLGKEKAQQVYTISEWALKSEDPKSFIEQNAPELVQNLQKNGTDWATVDQPTVQRMLQGVMAKAGSELGIGPAQPEAFTLGPGQNRYEGNRLVASAPERASTPSSYDEFALAQKDPDFAQFLKDRRGKGISMTMPDGTVVQVGGDGGGVAAGDLSGPTVNRLQEAIVQSTDELDRLNSIGQGFDPKFLQLPGRLKAGALKIKDFSGLSNLTPEESQYLDKFSTFKADSAKNLSTILNRLSGAAISPAEGERLKKGIPNDEDSPTQFIAKYRSAVKDSTRAIMRANWALKNGIGVQSVEQLSKAMPLNGIDQVYEQRANEIWQEMGGTPEAKAAAIKQANGEFGLAR